MLTTSHLLIPIPAQKDLRRRGRHRDQEPRGASTTMVLVTEFSDLGPRGTGTGRTMNHVETWNKDVKHPSCTSKLLREGGVPRWSGLRRRLRRITSPSSSPKLVGSTTRLATIVDRTCPGYLHDPSSGLPPDAEPHRSRGRLLDGARTDRGLERL